MSFNPGDKVIVNSGVIATILSYDEGINLVTYKVDLAGGSHERRTEHITNTTITALPELPFEGKHSASDEDADDE